MENEKIKKLIFETLRDISVGIDELYKQNPNIEHMEQSKFYVSSSEPNRPNLIRLLELKVTYKEI